MRRVLTIVLAAISVISFYSCNKLQELYAPLETEWIRFETGDVEASGTMETKSLENEITCDITDWDYVEEGEQTKAKLTESLSGSAGVYGFNFASWSETLTPNVMSNEKSKFDRSSLTTENKHLWKDCTEEKVRFYAYAPYGKFTVSGKDDAGIPYLTFTVPTDNSKQADILYAQSEDISKDNRNAVPLQFKHAMCAVQFRLGIDDATLNSVTVSNVKNTGKLSLDGTWSDLSGEETYTISSQDSLLLMIPQTLATGATVTLNYTPKDGSPTEIKASIEGTSWTEGKKVVYTLKKKPAPGTVEYIYFDFSAGDIILTDTDYKGYVFVAGDTSMVYGEHKANNKYYIYQSAPADLVPGNSKVWSENTGYQNESEKGTKIPTLPEYTPIEVDGKSWGEYVTNNTDPAAVLAKWNSFPENFLEPEPRRILIYGDSEFDVTLDRVYSRYFPYRGSTNGVGEKYKRIITTAPASGSGETRQYKDVYGGITIGQRDLNKYNTSWTSRPYKEKVTLRLKGNNYFSRIEYAKQIAQTTEGCLRITSEKGDKVAEGTLTVTLPYLRTAHPDSLEKGLFNFVRCALIGGGSNDANASKKPYLLYRQVKDLYFDGGIVYCGVEKINNSNWKTNENMIPPIGTNNAETEITINGGIVTAISNGTGPAIGGGAGWLKFGGKGTVTINGGTVYAYSFGVFNANSEVDAPVMSAAIGGGSSGNLTGAEGVVNIYGGTVYASSVGGCAIGGGTSAKQRGGTGSVTVEGGNIFANSVSGTIGGSYDATAGVAIGGGRSGNTSGDGGEAYIEIAGGTIVAGSIGGGQCGNTKGKLGRAEVLVSDGEMSAQFLLVKDKSAATANTFTMTGGVIKNSKTSDTEYVKVQKNGGAVYMESGTCDISGGTIEYCSGTLGGAVYMNGGEFVMSGTGKIADCQGDASGGGVYIEGGNATVSGGEVYNNIASEGDGGGVYVKGGNFTMTGGKVNNNAAYENKTTHKYGNGAGIYVASTTSDPEVQLLGGEIANNSSDRNGGGLCVDMSETKTHKATITIGNVEVEKRDVYSPNIHNNKTALAGGGMSVQGKGSNITIYSGTIKGNVCAIVKNEDIRNDGGMVELVGKNEEGKTPQVNVLYNTITYYANNEKDPEPYAEQRVITATNSPLDPASAGALDFKMEFFHIASWNTKRDGTGTRYPADGTGAVMNITSDVSLYAQWVGN